MYRLLSEKKKTRGSAKQNTPACTSEARASMLDAEKSGIHLPFHILPLGSGCFRLVPTRFSLFQLVSDNFR
jgi:hypothetical protein